MRHTADHRAQPELAYVCDHVCQLSEPGQRITVSRQMLQGISPLFHNDCRWSPAERVLSNIIGSKYTLSFWVNAETGDVTFERHLDTGVTRYKEPDDDVRLSRIKARREYNERSRKQMAKNFICRDELISELRSGRAIAEHSEIEVAQTPTKSHYFLERKPDYPDVHASTFNALHQSGMIVRDCGVWVSPEFNSTAHTGEPKADE